MKSYHNNKKVQQYSSSYGTRIPIEEVQEAIALIPYCINGCQRAQKRFYSIFHVPMLLVCLKYVNGDIEKAKDISQDAFTKVFANLNTIKSASSLHVWVTKVFYSEALDHFRISKTLKFRPNSPLSLNIEGKTIEVPYDASFEEMFDFEAITQSFAKRLKDILKLYVYGYSYEDIGRELNMPEGTIKAIVSRTRTKMKDTKSHYFNALY